MSITNQQRYLFDLQGYIVLEDVLSPSELQAAKTAIDANYHPPETLTQENCYIHFLHFAPVMLDIMVHPTIIEWVTELCGENPRLDHAYMYHMRRTQTGPLALHGGGDRVNHSEYYYFKNNRMHNGLVVVSVPLNDSNPGDGGFCCIPGSHKANYNYFDHFDATEYRPPVTHIPIKAGSVLIFTEALTHGTMPWRSETERRTLFYKYCPAAGSWARWDPEFFNRIRASLPQDWPPHKRAVANHLFSPPHIGEADFA